MTVTNFSYPPINIHNRYKSVLQTVGNTPLLDLRVPSLPHLNVYAKLEHLNPTGSVKARAACYILNTELQNGRINSETTIIESSSGNFGVALAAYCNKLGLKFICVVDPHISELNKMLILQYGATIQQVSTPDENGGYLLTRIRKVKELVGQIDNSYWVNQYANKLNSDGYYHTIGKEICDIIPKLDYAMIGVSSGGTITGLSRRLKEHYPDIKVIAVDIVGSVVFGDTPKKRYIPGIGSSMVPSILQHAKIDDFCRIEETDTIRACMQLLKDHQLFMGGSSGSVYAAIHQYFAEDKCMPRKHVLAIFPDGGEKYVTTVYNERWCKDTYGQDFCY
ncbi:MAG: 2,3-diaminopropionate biosynthesis protein SbnA [Bacteroidota bacterium]